MAKGSSKSHKCLHAYIKMLFAEVNNKKVKGWVKKASMALGVDMAMPGVEMAKF